FATDYRATVMFQEATAVVQERLAFPEAATWYEYIGDFQRRPHAPLFVDGVQWQQLTGEPSFYEYGAALFFLYLEQEHGDGSGALLRALWEAGAQPDDVGENDPDWMDAVESELGVDVADLLLDFATWRVLVNARAVDGDGLEGAAALP